MSQQREIQPIARFKASLRLPGSKSLTNRALLLGAMARGVTVLSDPLWADDTLRMYEALRELGVKIKGKPGDKQLEITGLDGFSHQEALTLDLGNSGISIRTLAAACTLGIGRYRLDGDARMKQRPIGELVEAMRKLGAVVRYDGPQGYPPIIVEGNQPQGGRLSMKPTLSSQYITALLQVGPYFRRGLTLKFEGAITSRPYVEMTLRLMQKFGVRVQVSADWSEIQVPCGGYQATPYAIEPDASNGSYFLAAAAILPGSSCTLEGLGKASLQGDVGFADVLHRMGADLVFGNDFVTIMSPTGGTKLQGIEIDLNDMPDMAQTLAVTALFAQGPTTIRNVGNLRVKETDRLAALQTELRKFGAKADIDGDDLRIEPAEEIKVPAEGVDTYNDHRMAMSFTVAGLKVPGVKINDPGCVGKTFPGFFEYVDKLGKF
ncbi:MAG: 3-phosphoshikimate 1-carboxyvinyltransferase [Phycisphaerales bacterium]|nr:3-phosphoshikimate 1-carboxyvinyltransferase [Phycisphaerales bacterium]